MIFRIAAREYFEYLDAVDKLSSSFEDCPFECPNSEVKYDRDRSDLCQTCPKRRQLEIFESQVMEAVTIKLGERDANLMDFSFFKKRVISILNLEGYSPEKIPMDSSILLNIALGERESYRKSR